tara:strand:- start:276 stop:455 length:180 start_codon:yes stop_codon:yes gene_type:complete
VVVAVVMVLMVDHLDLMETVVPVVEAAAVVVQLDHTKVQQSLILHNHFFLALQLLKEVI